jgi:hypothetical protein
VDIFAQADGGAAQIVARNVDECVLCRLCLDASGGSGADVVRVIKLYDNDALLA